MSKNSLVIANWKCNKTIKEALDWLHQVGPKLSDYENVQVVLCPSFVALFPIKQEVERAGYRLKLGAQNVAVVEAGA
ncbi:MAG: triose-phosphate isomerase, partial [Candidatus Levybacteria bacterium]|nr:triose-phosphate isomerase [Candidatus Levybacteria bacterium]